MRRGREKRGRDRRKEEGREGREGGKREKGGGGRKHHISPKGANKMKLTLMTNQEITKMGPNLFLTCSITEKRQTSFSKRHLVSDSSELQ